MSDEPDDDGLRISAEAESAMKKANLAAIAWVEPKPASDELIARIYARLDKAEERCAELEDAAKTAYHTLSEVEMHWRSTIVADALRSLSATLGKEPPDATQAANLGGDDDKGVESGSDAFCGRCGLPYEDFPADMIVPDDQWKLISPSGDLGGLLCPNCICKLLIENGATVIKGYADNLGGDDAARSEREGQ